MIHVTDVTQDRIMLRQKMCSTFKRERSYTFQTRYNCETHRWS